MLNSNATNINKGAAMSQSYSSLLIHIVFSTKNRENIITPDIQGELYSYVATICKANKSPLLKIGGMQDHIHILLSLSRLVAIAKLVMDIKTNSSKWLKTKDDKFTDFAWQKGYGAFTLGQSAIKQCADYIANQAEHHKTISFENEFLNFLEKYQIKYNQKYIWL